MDVHIQVTGWLAEHLENEGRHDLVDAGEALVNDEELQSTIARSHAHFPGWTEERRREWAAFFILTKKRLSESERAAVGPAATGIDRVAQAQEGTAREFRALKGAFDAQHQEIASVGLAVVGASTAITGALSSAASTRNEEWEKIKEWREKDIKDAKIVELRNAMERFDYIETEKVQRTWEWVWRVAILLALIFLIAIHGHAQAVTITQGGNTAKVTSNGYLEITCPDGTCTGGGGGGGGTASPFGSSFPANGTAAGFKDASGNMSWGTLDVSGNLKVLFANTTLAVTGTFFQALQPVSCTAANCAVNLTQIGGASLSLGQQLAAASVPIVLTSAQITALTPPAALTNFALETGGNLATLAGGVAASIYQENLKQVNGVTTLAGAGATGTGSQRETVAQDTTTIAGSAPGTAGSASANVITVQGIASMVKLLVTPDANSAVNLAQLAGTTTDTNSGSKSAGTLRVVLATDQPQLTNKLLVTPDANSAINLSQVNGVTVLTGTGATGTGAQRVTLSVDSATVGGSASVPAGTNTIGSVKLTDGTTVQITDPCRGNVKNYKPFSVATSSGATLVTGTSAKKQYICSLAFVSATAQNIAFIEGTGTVCATNPVGLMGGATAATGFNLAANGGLTFGNGDSSLAVTTVNANNICILPSGSGQISGVMTSVPQ